MAESTEVEHTWQACAKWLCTLDILPSNHKVMMPDAKIRDLGKLFSILIWKCPNRPINKNATYFLFQLIL